MKRNAERRDWSDIRSRLNSLADAIGEECCEGTWPVPVRKVVERRATLVNRGLPAKVFFRPMWADGCVVVTDSGFEIYISCPKEEIKDYELRYQNEIYGRGLPRRTRYTIAHEIMHTLLYDSIQGEPRGRVKSDHHATLKALEESCEKAACRVLLPTNLLRAETRTSSIYDPDVLRALSDKANVSAPAIVQRMGELGPLLDDIGAFAYVKQCRSEREVDSFSAHISVRPIFQNVRRGQSLSSFLKRTTKEFVLNGGDKYAETVEFNEQPDWAKRFEFRCETERSKRNHQGFFVTARLLTPSPTS